MCASPSEYKTKGILRYLIVSVLVPAVVWIVVSTWSVSKRDSDISSNTKSINTLARAVEITTESQQKVKESSIRQEVKQERMQQDLQEISKDVKSLLRNSNNQ